MMRCELKYLFVTLLLLFCAASYAQKHCVVAFYNVENLMDVENDPTTQDDDMLPHADREWNVERYHHKLQSVARVISDLAKLHNYPALLALAEVENGNVLCDLVGQPTIADADYSFVHYDSPDERGIDVALLYRSDSFVVERSCALRADVEQPTRDHLMVWGELCGEPVLVVVVHFPSRIGGSKFTSRWREYCAEQVRATVDSVRRVEPRRSVIIMGDMNDTPHDKSVKSSLGAATNIKHAASKTLYNPFARVRGQGSMVYRDRWYQYDQIILSNNFLSRSRLSLVEHKGCRGYLFSQPYMLDARGYPLPTYKATDYLGGVSDHLPVYVLLRKND